jgi:hypothetical protein
MKKLYMRDGQLFTVDNTPSGLATEMLKTQEGNESPTGMPDPEK